MAYVKDRGNHHFLVRISLGVDEHGKVLQKSKTFSPSSPDLSKAKLKKELDAFIANFEHECKMCPELQQSVPLVENRSHISNPIAVPTPVSNTTPTFGEFCEEYKRIKKDRLAPSSWQLYITAINHFFLPMFGDMHLNEIRPHHIQKAINFFSSPEGRMDGKGKTLAPSTIRRYLTILQSIMTLAYKQEYIDSNPADSRRLEIPKIIYPEVQAFTDDEIEAILSGLKEEPNHIRAVIATALFTGARRGEIAGLKWDDIDFQNRTVHIRRSIYKIKDQPPQEKIPKTISSIRQIAIPKILCDILAEHKKEQDKRIALLGKDWFHGNYVFTEADGHVMHPHTPTKQFDHFLKRHHIRHLKFHGLRHSSATLLLSHGCDIKTVSKRLGHTSIDTTNIYVHALEKTDQAAANYFDQFANR